MATRSHDQLMQTTSLPGRREKIYSVSEVCRNIKQIVEDGFPEGVWIEGEISNLRIPASGHMYFSLKDSQSVIQAVLFRGNAMGIRFTPEDGLKVLLFGAVSIYEKSSSYQIRVQRMEPMGLGGLALAFEQLKAKLFHEGLFDAERKKNIPLLPREIAVITSPSGAALRDILRVLDRRFSNMAITIYPVMVQGEAAAASMIRALDDLNAMGGFDVILITRGGGSLEDLWPFNDENLARKIAASTTPVISAVGHEVDTTICDMVADLRCPTPSAAAEMVVARKDDFILHLENLLGRITRGLENLVGDARNRLQLALRSPGFLEPSRLLEKYAQRVDDAIAAMADALQHALEIGRKDFERLVGKLEALSPLGVLGRGYSITYAGVGLEHIVRSPKTVRVGETIKTVLVKGSIRSTVSKVEHGA